MAKYVWYASYGSNMYKPRFMAYIKGSRVPGLEFVEEGCKDTSDPLDEGAMLLPHQTYFARRSLRWSGSPVFMQKNKSNTNVTAYGRMYLITEEQFDDVLAQENYLETDLNLHEARQTAQQQGYCILNHNAWYGTLVFLGTAFSNKTTPSSHWPVFTFTYHSDQTCHLGPPSPLYLNTMVKGITQMRGLPYVRHDNDRWVHAGNVFSVSVEELVQHFASQPGVEGNHTIEVIKEIVETAIFVDEEEEVVEEANLVLENNFICGMDDRGWMSG